MNLNNYNDTDFNEETAEDILSNPYTEKPKKTIRNKAKKMVKKTGKAFKEAFLLTFKALLPYFGVALAILLVAIFSYYILFEFVGTEKEYTKEYENKATKTEEGIYMTSEDDMNMENKTVRDFYRYFTGQSFWQLKGKDNKKLISPDDKEAVEDYYKREDIFKLNPNLLFSLDENMYNWSWKYPEQFIKPVNYNEKDLTLKQLTDKDGILTAKSVKEDIKTGKKTEKKIVSVRDYGLGSILKYNEKENYERRLKAKGKYVKKDVWDEKAKSVKTIKIDEPFEFNVEKPKPIYLIDKAILFTGEIEYEYEYQEQKYADLTPGQAKKNEEKTPKTEYVYATHIEPNCKIEKNESGIPEKICGKPKKYPLKMYREGEIVEEVPIESNVKTNDKGKEYLEDYLHNFESYVPEDVTDKFNFENLESRIDYDSYVFDYDGILEDNYGFNLGSALKNKDKAKKYKNSMQYFDIIQKHSKEFGVDPYIILALMAQESGGKNSGSSTIEKYGIMQIYGNDRTVHSTNTTGQPVTVHITTSEKKDTDKAVRWATAYYKYLLDYMKGDNYKAIQAYNLGEGTLTRIKKKYPEAWDSGLNWLIHREWARAKQWPGTRGASYHCMDFPEGKPNVGGTPAGDPCYLENILQYYTGKDMDKTGLASIDNNFIKNGLETLGDLFKKFIPERKKEKPIPKMDFKNHIGDNRTSDVLMIANSLDNEILFSEAENELSTLNFWDKGFMDSIASNNLNLQDIMNIAPNPNGYLPPIIFKPGVRISSRFGYRIHPLSGKRKLHAGTDIAAKTGTPVYAIADSKVIKSGFQGGPSSGAGNYVKINIGNGVEVIYMHLSKRCVKEGEIVKAGDVVGEVGSTGGSTGPHLHFELRKNGSPFDSTSIAVLGKSENKPKK